jgi:anaerobic C4-dicarboxylate transporter
MPRRNMVIDSTPSPQNITIIMALLRAGIIILGAMGVTTAEYTDAQLMPLGRSALAVIFGLAWQVYEQFRQPHAARRCCGIC